MENMSEKRVTNNKLSGVKESTNGNSSRGNMSVREAGQKGGAATSQKYGPEFYEMLGHKGGDKVRDLIKKAKSQKKK